MVVLSIIGIVSSLITLIFAATGTTVAAISDVSATDDTVPDDSNTATGVGAFFAIFYAIALVLYIWQLCAALRYSICMLCVSIVWQLYCFAISIYSQSMNNESVDGSTDGITWTITIITNIIIYGLYIYPLVGLILEIKKGIMSKETYPREAYSCCCQPNP